ncbi:PREDICTED: CD99 antigen-like [Buceros rhinoceros silvestris]|uniref:CD99 antigen-like n=1 Tax=Buceros rhinoceros silvestris TaxID=175836 RepID=UPI0005283EA4|nr:PREDICTED: CD99 antigen-like [Buceros rhinoceros silvestris]
MSFISESRNDELSEISQAVGLAVHLSYKCLLLRSHYCVHAVKPVCVLNVLSNLEDFSLEDALATTKKPVPSQKPSPSDSDDFNLEDAFQPDDPKPGPPANPRDPDKPRQNPPTNPKESGNFDDTDLFDSSLPIGGGDSDGSNDRKGASPNDGEQSEDPASQGAIAGIVSAVFATVIGAVSSFIAYQKKKLCFKQSADEENVNMESHRGAQSEPPGKRRI